jgi:hypothetical protein
MTFDGPENTRNNDAQIKEETQGLSEILTLIGLPDGPTR